MFGVAFEDTKPCPVSAPSEMQGKCHLGKGVRGIGSGGMEAILPFDFMGMSPSHDKASIPIPGSSVEDTTAAGTKGSLPSRSGKLKGRSTHTANTNYFKG